MTIKVKKLSNEKYEVEESSTTKQVSIVEKVELEKAIAVLKQDIAEHQTLLTYKENLLKEINKL